MKALDIEVTQEDIALGAHASPHYCPVALAMRRVMGEPVSVGSSVWYYDGSLYASGFLPDPVVRWIATFDSEKPVDPIRFQINLYEFEDSQEAAWQEQ